MSPDDPHQPSGPPSQDILAAEYVLGTLDLTEREEAQVLLASDPGFAALVGQWERRLGELHALVPAVDPPAAVWDGIKARLPDVPRPGRPSAEVVDLMARLGRWRGIAAAAGSLAAILTLFIVASAIAPAILPEALRLSPRDTGQRTAAAAPEPARFVAVLQPGSAAAPAFIITVDIPNRSLTIRRVAAEQEPGKSYELWLVSNRFPAPRSLGLVTGTEFTQSDTLQPFDAGTISDASFAVSLEPETGSPTGAPSNVMFIGKLIESVPPPAQPRVQ